MQTCSSRHFHSTWQVQEQEKPEKPSFLGAGEFHRLNDKSQGRIDEFGNFQTAEGLAMPTQSSGGLTKRNNSDISELDIFEGEGAVITAYSESGFVINEEYTEGSILSFPKRFWSWKPKTIQEITMENLAPIWLHNPVPRTSLFPVTAFYTLLLTFRFYIWYRAPHSRYWSHAAPSS